MSSRKSTANRRRTAAPRASQQARTQQPAAGAPAKPWLSLVKNSRPKRLSLVKTLPLPERVLRTQEAPGGAPHFTDAEYATARTALAARLAGMTGIPVMAWHTSPAGGVQQTLPGGIVLHHPGVRGEPFTVWVPCLLGGIHPYTVRSGHGLDAAIADATACAQPHTAFDGLEPVPFTDLSAAFAHAGDPEATAKLPVVTLQQLQGGDTPA